MPLCIGSVVLDSPNKFLARDRGTSCRISAKLGIEGKSGLQKRQTLLLPQEHGNRPKNIRINVNPAALRTQMTRLAVAAATATVPTYVADIPVLIHQRLKDGAARNKATLTFAEKRV